MVKDLHTKLLKYAAIFGLVPFIKPNEKQKQHLKAISHHSHHHNHLQRLHRRFYQQHRLYRNSNNYNRPLRWQQIYTVTLIAANLITTLYGINFFPYGDNFIVSNLVSIMVFLVQIITVISILLETMFGYEKYYELINNYNSVEMLMKQFLNIQLCTKEIRQRQKRKYCMVFITVYGSLVVSITVILIKTYCGYFYYALMAILIIRTRCVQMSIYLDYIVYYLELFNVKLRALISSKIDNNYFALDIDYEHLESFEYLQNLKTIYQELYALHEKFNELYGFSLASIFTVLVLDVIINMYWTVLTTFEYYESYYLYITLAALTPLFVILFVLCYTGEQCEAQILANIATYLIILLQFRKANVSEKLPSDKMSTNITGLYDSSMQIDGQ